MSDLPPSGTETAAMPLMCMGDTHMFNFGATTCACGKISGSPMLTAPLINFTPIKGDFERGYEAGFAAGRLAASREIQGDGR